MDKHKSMIHSAREYANPEMDAHVNTAEAVLSRVQRALVCVYHNLGHKHLQRRLDEITWRLALEPSQSRKGGDQMADDQKPAVARKLNDDLAAHPRG